MVKNQPANAGDKDLIPGLERPPGEEMATHSSILAWKIPWTEEPGGLQSLKSQRVRHDWVTNTSGVPHTGSVYIYICIYTYIHASVYTLDCHVNIIWGRTESENHKMYLLF